MKRALLVTGLLGGILLAVAVFVVDALRWRVHVAALAAQGQIYDLTLREVFPMLLPGSGYYLEDLIDTRNPFESVRNPIRDDTGVRDGATMYADLCSNCHGGAGEGSVGPALNEPPYQHGDSDWAIYRSITRGISGSAMTPQPVTTEEAWQIAAFIRTLAVASKAEPMHSISPVTPSRLDRLRAEPDNWLTYSANYDGTRFSELDQIRRSNIDRLALAWAYQGDTTADYLETSPIVNEGVMFATISPSTVVALDAQTGRQLWQNVHQLPRTLSLCCGAVNRGVGVGDDLVFVGTLDARLIAMDASSGETRWIAEVADHRLGYSITSAPLVVDDLVIIGVSGGEFGIRGHLDAYRMSTGERVWRFYTVPGPGEPGHETWEGESWKRGGAGAWLTGSYDPETGTLFWGTGNPGPLYYGDDREGDNLYANSLVALDVRDGTLKWYFQFTPHDLHDWASNQVPILIEEKSTGRRLVATANRNGFFYLLDRLDGSFILAEPFVRQNWALGIDDTGRPVRNPNVVPTPEGVATWPSPHGGTNWQSPSFSQDTRLFYVASMDGGRTVYKTPETPAYTPGEYFLGGNHELISRNHPFVPAVKAIDPLTGKVAWSYEHPARVQFWRTGGVMATAGGLVFHGDEDRFVSLDAASGQEIWRVTLGGLINAAPISYAVAGRQFVTIAAGKTLFTFALPEIGSSAVVPTD